METMDKLLKQYSVLIQDIYKFIKFQHLKSKVELLKGDLTVK